MPLSYRNQSIDLLHKSMDWFLYDSRLRHERVKKDKEFPRVCHITCIKKDNEFPKIKSLKADLLTERRIVSGNPI